MQTSSIHTTQDVKQTMLKHDTCIIILIMRQYQTARNCTNYTVVKFWITAVSHSCRKFVSEFLRLRIFNSKTYSYPKIIVTKFNSFLIRYINGMFKKYIMNNLTPYFRAVTHTACNRITKSCLYTSVHAVIKK